MILHRNLYWMLFLGVIACSALAYTGYALFHVYHYQRLDRPISPERVEWSVLAANDETFFPQVHYQFIFKGTRYTGQTRLKEHYLNEWTAREAIERLQKQKLPVWIDSSSPNWSTLQKAFPLKPVLYACLLWGLLVYLLWLDHHVMRYKG